MNFGQAIEALKQGKKVQRQGWNGKGMFLFLSDESVFKTRADLSCLEEISNNPDDFKFEPSIVMKTAQNSFVVGWLASQTDMLSDDWQEV